MLSAEQLERMFLWIINIEQSGKEYLTAR